MILIVHEGGIIKHCGDLKSAQRKAKKLGLINCSYFTENGTQIFNF